jgi:hypothetical protein
LFLFFTISPSVSPVELVYPNLIKASYVLSASSKNLENFVASPRQMGSKPIAIGSRVPVCPALKGVNNHFIFDNA